MATIQVQFAFVEDVLSGDKGVWALKTSEPHSRKNDRDEWETTSRTFRTVRVGRDSGINLETFAKGDRISFTGTEKTDVREHQGKKYYDLLVWADTITLSTGRSGGQEAREQVPAPADEPWAATGPQADAWGGDSNVPF